MKIPDTFKDMAQKYLGQDEYPYRTPGEIRVLYYIEPTKVATME